MTTLRPTTSTRARSTGPRSPLRATAHAAQVACGADRLPMLGRTVHWVALVLLGLVPWSDVLAQTNVGLPNACQGAACGGRAFVQDGTLSNLTSNGLPPVVGRTMTVQQSSNTSLLNWQNFNITNGSTVRFEHINPAQAFTSINRIHDTQRSVIDGRISAPMGQIYLINPNGLLFGSNASVDVAGLIASTLQINAGAATSGLLSQARNRAVFEADPQTLAGRVDVEKGAVINAGRVYIFAPEVNQGGKIEVTPGGQVLLGAGQKVYLASSDQPTLRGLLVEVGQGGTVTNSGEIVTPRGNTTLVGMTVNQAGSIHATSALYENGSIYLRAREVVSTGTGIDGASASNISTVRAQQQPLGRTAFVPTATGTVTVAAGSVTQVSTDFSDTRTASLTDENVLKARSLIAIDGRVVDLQGEAGKTTLLQARGGDIAIAARATVANIPEGAVKLLGAEDTSTRLTVNDHVTLDVSGERNVQVDGERNYQRIERLTSNDLRDAPGQRDGFLRGQEVYVNVAQDHDFIDLSARKAAVAGTRAEFNASAGNIKLASEGRIDVARDAVLNVSGGSTVTSAARGRTSQLVTADGRRVDIMKAKETEEYIGFADRITVTEVAPREGINQSVTYDAPTYTQSEAFTSGTSAGTVEWIAPRGSFAGSIQGEVLRAAHQRDDTALKGARLVLGTLADSNLAVGIYGNFSRPNVVLGRAGDLPNDPSGRTLVIDTEMLRAGGVQRLSVLSDGSISVAENAALDLGVRGELSLRGRRIDVRSDLTARGGSIGLAERPEVGKDEFGNAFSDPGNSLVLGDFATVGSVRFAEGVTLDVAGSFTNDAATPGTVRSDAIGRNGGRITVSGRDVDLSPVAKFDLSAGASVSATGVLTGGKGGSLTLSGSYVLNDVEVGRLVLGDRFAQRIDGHGYTAGGTLNITAPLLTLGAAEAAGATRIDPTVFTAAGFETFGLTGRDGLTVQAGTQIRPRVALYAPLPNPKLAPESARVAEITRPMAPLDGAERATTIELSANRTLADVVVAQGAHIDAGAQGAITLTAGHAVNVQGALVAHGGSVSATVQELLDGAESRVLRVGDNARIDVSGVERVQLNARGERRGSVLDGGTVNFGANQAHLAIDAGAVVNADGATGRLDITQQGITTRTDVASRGGAVNLVAGISLNVNGQVSARSGAPERVEGGRLSVQFRGLGRGAYENILEAMAKGAVVPGFEFFRADRVLTVGGAATALPASGQGFGLGLAGRGHLAADLFTTGGFDTVWLGSSQAIQLASTQAIAPRGALTLDTPVLRVAEGVQATLGGAATSSVSLGNRQSGAGLTSSPLASASLDGAARGGEGRLNVQARHVELLGHTTLQGVGNTHISATDDVQLRGTAVGLTTLREGGSLTTGGDLVISAAQLTPATQTDFLLQVTGTTDGRIVVAPQAGSTPLEPLSAVGQVALRAPHIDVTGRITAPHGSIDLEAGQTLTVGPQAVLSVAGTQAVPYGAVFNNGADWVYGQSGPSNATDTGRTVASRTGVTLPGKGIRLHADEVDVAPTARIDLRGGGDLVAQEFVPGPGGSHDVRLNCVDGPCVELNTVKATDTRNPMFALIPARGDHAAPFDPMTYADLAQNSAAGGLNLLPLGQTITLAAGSSLPAGTYTVLPIRYATLPGAYAVQAVPGYADFRPGSRYVEAGGTTVVAGRFNTAGAGASQERWSGFRVLDNSQFGRTAELTPHSAQTYFTQAALAAEQTLPRLPLDAATLSVSANEALRFATTSLQAAAASRGTGAAQQTGRGVELALSAPQMRVSDFSADLTLPPAPAPTLSLNAQALSALNAETLVLGASVKHGDGSAAQRSHLTLGHLADQVQVSSAQPLSAGEVLLVASDTVRLDAGARVEGSATQTPVTARVTPGAQSASLHVSQADLPLFDSPGQQGSGTQGNLVIGDNVRLSGRAVRFAASREQQFADTMQLRAAQASLAASRMNLGDAPTDAPGLRLGAGLLGRFSNVDALELRSSEGFHVYGTAALTTPQQLTLDGPGFLAGNSTATASFNSGDLVLRNTSGSLASSPVTSTGTLSFRADAAASPEAQGHVSFEGVAGSVGGHLMARGFAQTSVAAIGRAADANTTVSGTGQMRFSGNGSLTAEGDLRLDAARISAGRLAEHSVTATGLLRTAATSAPMPASDIDTELGAKLTLRGRRIEHGGRIELPSGSVTLAATGTAASDDVTLLAGSRLRVAGSTQSFADQTADASAGTIQITSTAGSVRSRVGSEIDISAGVDHTRAGAERPRNADGGRLLISATSGQVELAGLLDAGVNTATDSPALGAKVEIDVGTLPELGVVARWADQQPLGELDVRVRQGNVNLAQGNTVKAQTLRLTADGQRAESGSQARDGRIEIDGRLDASGVRGGRVELFADDSVLLGATSVIDAHASGLGETGGSVFVSSRIGPDAGTLPNAIVIAQGASVDVRGLNGQAANATQSNQDIYDFGGTVTLRAPRINGNDVAIRGQNATTGQLEALPNYLVTGARQEVIEGTVVYDGAAANLSINTSGVVSGGTSSFDARTTLQNYMTAQTLSDIANRLGRAVADGGGAHDGRFNLRPGLEVRTAGKITVAGPLDFTGLTGSNYNWRYGSDRTKVQTSQPGALTLRAGGDVEIQGGLQDGYELTGTLTAVTNNNAARLTPFAPATRALLPGEVGNLDAYYKLRTGSDSWRYQLTAGTSLSGQGTTARVAGAAPSNVRSDAASGHVLFRNQQTTGSSPRDVATNVPWQTRTGTGRIDINAAGNIGLNGEYSLTSLGNSVGGTKFNTTAIFTGGMRVLDAPLVPPSQTADPAERAEQLTIPNFANTNVANLSPSFTQHGGSVQLKAGGNISAPNRVGQLVNNWLWRSGTQTDGDFQGVTQAPTAWWVNAASFVEGVGALGGGNLNISAGGNVSNLTAAVPSSAFLRFDRANHSADPQLVQYNGGSLSVTAGNTVTSGTYYAQRGALNLKADSLESTTNGGLMLAQADNVARVQARLDLSIMGSMNPTLNAPIGAQRQTAPVFSTFGDQSELDLRSLGGDVAFAGTLENLRLIGSGSQNSSFLNLTSDVGSANQLPLNILPGTLDMVGFGGSLKLGASKRLAPQAAGQLRLLAHDDISGPMLMLDLDPAPERGRAGSSAVPTPLTPVPWVASLSSIFSQTGTFRPDNLDSPRLHSPIDGAFALHANDPQPVQVVTRTGDLDGATIHVPKPIEVKIAGDIVSSTVSFQNLRDTQASRIHAGGDINAKGLATTSYMVQANGPGAAEILAGGDIDLGVSAGLIARGNLNNPNLPESGATMVVAAGLGRGGDGYVQRPDYNGVVGQYLANNPFAAAGADAASLSNQVMTANAWAKVAGIADADHDWVLNAERLRAVLPASALGDAELAALLNPASPRPKAERAQEALGLVWAQRGSAAQGVQALVSGLSPAARTRLGVELAQRVQAVANERFQATQNTDSFAPGYMAFRDLFPQQSSGVGALRHFVANNPFAKASNAAGLRDEVLTGLPQPLADLLRAGVAQPGAIDDPASAFNQALAALSSDEQALFSRVLMSRVQAVAGTALDALRTDGKFDAGKGTPFASGLDNLARAFMPADPLNASRIVLVQSQVRTEQPGDMALFAPTGGVLLGLTAAGGTGAKAAHELGLLSYGGGGIVGMVRDNFDVNKSRAFTVAGGDIHLWASQGNVDAGRGPRDAAVAPPPVLKIDSATGVVSLDVSSSVSGSGIGALVTRETQPDSDIRLMAPNGYIDAGEAGIRADRGQVFLGTNVVLNGGNISAAKGISGGAVVVAPPPPLPQAASSAGQADKAVEGAQKTATADQKEAEDRAKRERRKRVTGEFIGFGDD